MKILTPLGRILFSVLFITSGISHFQYTDALTVAADGAGLPFPRASVLVSGAVILVGGILVLFGFAARIGAAMIAAFLVIAALTVNDFWTYADPQEAQAQMAHFMKNLAIAGGALLLVYFGPGPYSVDEARHAKAPGTLPLRERRQEP